MKLCACNCGYPLTPRGLSKKVRFLHGHHWRAKSKTVKSQIAKKAYATRQTLYVMAGCAAKEKRDVRPAT